LLVKEVKTGFPTRRLTNADPPKQQIIHIIHVVTGNERDFSLSVNYKR